MYYKKENVQVVIYADMKVIVYGIWCGIFGLELRLSAYLCPRTVYV